MVAEDGDDDDDLDRDGRTREGGEADFGEEQRLFEGLARTLCGTAGASPSFAVDVFLEFEL